MIPDLMHIEELFTRPETGEGKEGLSVYGRVVLSHIKAVQDSCISLSVILSGKNEITFDPELYEYIILHQVEYLRVNTDFKLLDQKEQDILLEVFNRDVYEVADRVYPKSKEARRNYLKSKEKAKEESIKSAIKVNTNDSINISTSTNLRLVK